MELFAKIGAAMVLGLALIMYWPRARQMMQESREAESDWMGVALPLVAVVAFVVLLVLMVQ